LCVCFVLLCVFPCRLFVLVVVRHPARTPLLGTTFLLPLRRARLCTVTHDTKPPKALEQCMPPLAGVST
jgi:hypothetical protein